MIEIAFRHGIGTLDMSVDIRANNAVTAIFGHSGCGKTTLINVVAGLVRPVEGKVVVNDRVFLDTDKGIFLNPERRRVGYVFQDARLFPHMSVLGNLRYGIRPTIRHRTEYALDGTIALLELAPLLNRFPGALSGGEKQRVSIGRALLSGPELLLMDEPLASLDRPHKQEILPFIRRLCRQYTLPVLYVSHSIDEVVQLADSVVTMARGKTTGHGPVEGIFDLPDDSADIANPDASTVFCGRVHAHDDEYHLSTVTCGGGTLIVPRCRHIIGEQVRVRIRARDVTIGIRPPAGASVLNVLTGVLLDTRETRIPGQIDVFVGVNDTKIVSRITRRSYEVLALNPGTRVYLMVKSVAIE